MALQPEAPWELDALQFSDVRAPARSDEDSTESKPDQQFGTTQSRGHRELNPEPDVGGDRSSAA